MKQAKEKAIPKKKYHTNYNYNKNKLPQTIINMIKLKRRALRLFQKTRTREDRILYRQLQEEVRNEIIKYKNYKFEKMTTSLTENYKLN